MLPHSRSVTLLATGKNVWDKCIIFTISRVLGYLGEETKTALHLCLGIWPALKFYSCVANIVVAQQVACCALKLQTGAEFSSLLAIADYLTSLLF